MRFRKIYCKPADVPESSFSRLLDPLPVRMQRRPSMPCLQSSRSLDACRAVQKEHPELKIAGFHIGLFMNYLGFGAPHTEEDAVHGIVYERPVVWHMKNMKERNPLLPEGNIPRLSLTELSVVGRFAAAACLLPRGV